MGSRPNFLDPKYDGLSSKEMIRQVDRDTLLWEQNEKLEQQNKLIAQEARLREEQIESERENAERIAQATIQAERERSRNQTILEQQRKEHEEVMRYKKLCDELGFDYDDLIEFEKFLSYTEYDLKIENNYNKVDNYTTEYNKLKENPPKEKPDLKNYTSKISKLNNKIKNIKFKIFNKTKIIQYEKQIEDINNKMEEYINEFYIKLPEIKAKYEQELKRYEDLIKNEKDNIEHLEQEQSNLIHSKITNFLMFREEHYNDDVEQLFRKLKLTYSNSEIKLGIRNRGTVKDYISYIQNELDSESYANLKEAEFIRAVDLVIEKQEVSVQFIMKNLRVSSDRANEIIKMMEERVIILADSNKITITSDRWKKFKNGMYD